MSRKIGVYMENRVSGIIEGERGVGKSSLILSLTVCGDEMKPSRVVYRSLSPVSRIEILDQIYLHLRTEEADRGCMIFGPRTWTGKACVAENTEVNLPGDSGGSVFRETWTAANSMSIFFARLVDESL